MMKHLLLFAILASCGEAKSADIHQNWILLGRDFEGKSSPSEGLALSLNRDGSYTSTVLSGILGKSANAEVTLGHFIPTSDTISLYPTQSTCPETTADPQYVGYTLAPEGLLLRLTQGVEAFQARPETVSDEYTLTQGCYESAGSDQRFVPLPFVLAE